jgi:glycosyltransferase involved in cell wall biosynthesis
MVDQPVGSDVHIAPLISSWGFKQIPKIVYYVRQIRPDIVHLQLPSIGYGRGLGVHWLPLFMRTKRVIVTLHEFDQLHLLHRAVMIPALIFAEKIIVPTEWLRYALGRLSWRFRWKTFTIPVGSNIDRKDGHTLGWEGKRICYFGMLYPGKGLEILLRAFKIVRLKKAGASLTIIGQAHPFYYSYSERLKALSEQMSLKVEWLHHLNQAEVSERLSGSDICVLPFEDGATLRRTSLVAAAAHGLPIITTRPYPSLSEELKDYRNVLFVKRGSAFELAQAILILMDSPQLRRRLSQGALQLSINSGWEEIAKRHIQIYSLP